MGKVFVPQDSGRLNITPALKYGSLGSLMSTDCPITRVDEMYEMVVDWLAPFDTNNDYLMLIGDPVLIALCVSFLARSGSRLRLLKWDRQTKEYIPIIVMLEAPHA